jgi:transposase
MSKKSLQKLFNLKGYILDKIEYADSENIDLHCHLQRKGMKYRGETSRSVCVTKQRKIKHQVFEGKTVWIIVTQRRFFFTKYDQRLWEKLPNVSIKKQTSNTYRINTIKSLSKASYTLNADLRRSSAMFSSRLVDELPEVRFNWPDNVKRIGMDGKNIGKRKQMITISNLEHKQLISVLPPMSQSELICHLKSVENAKIEAVQEVCIDMDKLFKSVALQCFPQAKIVIDEFHVIQQAIRNFEALRLRTQKMRQVNLAPIKHLLTKPFLRLCTFDQAKLKYYLDKYPELNICYVIIEELRKMYWQKDIESSKFQIDKVIDLCRKSKIPDMLELAGTLNRWHDEILNYHLSKTTNAFTEGLHTRFEAIKRNHYGVRNYERFVKRLMYVFIPAALLANLLSKVVG